MPPLAARARYGWPNGSSGACATRLAYGGGCHRGWLGNPDAGLWLASGTGRALMAGTGRTLAYGLPWHGMAGSQAATEVLGQSARASQVLASF